MLPRQTPNARHLTSNSAQSSEKRVSDHNGNELTIETITFETPQSLKCALSRDLV